MTETPTAEETAAAEEAARVAAAEAAKDKTFTQAEVDRIVQERVARVKTTPPEDYEDLKAAKERLDEIEASNKSDLEKAQARTAQLEREKAAAEERAQRTLVNSAIVAEAAKRGIDTDIAVAMIDRSSVEYDSDGAPTNIATAMDSLLEAKPNLAAKEDARGSADQGARNGNGATQLTREQLNNLSPDDRVKALKEGRLDNVLKGS